MEYPTAWLSLVGTRNKEPNKERMMDVKNDETFIHVRINYFFTHHSKRGEGSPPEDGVVLPAFSKESARLNSLCKLSRIFEFITRSGKEPKLRYLIVGFHVIWCVKCSSRQ